jgi:hypothetical protein
MGSVLCTTGPSQQQTGPIAMFHELLVKSVSTAPRFTFLWL